MEEQVAKDVDDVQSNDKSITVIKEMYNTSHYTCPIRVKLDRKIDSKECLIWINCQDKGKQAE